MATPIDFQILYTQSANVAQNVSAQQNALKLSEYSQQQIIAQKNLEDSKKVQQTGMDNKKSSVVNENGRGGGNSRRFESKKRKVFNPDETLNSSDSEIHGSNDGDESRVKEAHLGNIIDITG